MKITKDEDTRDAYEKSVDLVNTKQDDPQSGIELFGQFFKNLSDVCYAISDLGKGKNND